MEESKQINQVIDVLMLAGTLLIESGSEIHRVEDTMIRIAHSQGIVDCNVLAMPVAIFFSIENANVTRMKRILRTNYNIEKVCDVNQISRQLVSGEIDLKQAYQALSELKMKRVPYTNLQLTIAATLSAPFFSIMFGDFFSGFLTVDVLPKNLSQLIIKEKSPDTVYICFPNASAPPISPREIADHTEKGVSMRVVGERLPSVKIWLPVLLSRI